MKRITALVLLCTFLYSTGTIHAITLHFCAGDLSSVSFVQSQNQGCGKCNAAEKKSCCKDVVKIVKTDQYNKADFSFQYHHPIIIEPSVIEHGVNAHAYIPYSVPFSHYANAPPFLYKEALFIVYRSLII